MTTRPPELLKGTLDLLILRTLELTPLHGAAVADRIGQVTRGTFDTDVRVSRDGRTLVVARQSVAAPVDLYALDATGRELRRLTRANDALLSSLALQPAEEFWFEGAGGTRVQ